jgi:antitoxin component YwqK of YwqJK toxin-antitoxin module
LTKTPYKDGLKEGTALFYHTNTRLLQSAISYTQGVKNGTALYYDRMGKLNERASYKYDLKQGLYFNLHYSFAIDSTYYLNGYEKAFFEEIQTNDSIATILLDKNFDLVKTTNKLEKKCAYDDSLKILQCLFFDQWEHLNRIETYNIETEITTVEIYKNKGKRLDEYNLVNSKKEKIFFGLKYHKNGRIRKISSFQDGLVHGQVTTYYDNGTFKTNKIYTAGKKNGRYITYYPDGKLKTTGYYLHGEKHNDWSYFNTDGSLNYTVTYKAMSNHSYEEESNYFTQNNIQPPPEGYELKSIFRKLLSPPPPPPPAPKFIEEDWD